MGGRSRQGCGLLRVTVPLVCLVQWAGLSMNLADQSDTVAEPLPLLSSVPLILPVSHIF